MTTMRPEDRAETERVQRLKAPHSDADGPTAGGEGDGTGETAQTRSGGVVEGGLAGIGEQGCTIVLPPINPEFAAELRQRVIEQFRTGRVQVLPPGSGVQVTDVQALIAERDDLRRKLAAVRAVVDRDPIDARRAYTQIRRALDGGGE